MRIRTVLCWGLAVVGVFVALLGLALMALLGPDGRVTTGPHAIDTDGSAVVTDPGALTWAGVQVDLLVEVPIDKPVFVGVGNTIDVEDYVQETARVAISDYATPWTISTREIEGEPHLPSAPTALDWWIAGQAGLGGASISLTLPDEPVSVAIVAIGSTNLNGLEVTLAYGIKGGFGRGAGIALLGIGLVWFAYVWRRDNLWRDDALAAAPEYEPEYEEVEVYVYVDDHGVEHEIDPADLAEYELAEDEEEGR